MTDMLFQRFRKRFPAINGQERITIYEAYERIHLNLIAPEFVDAPFINPQEEIKDLASKVFDVNFCWGHTYYNSIKKVPTIIFSPKILSKNEGGTEELMRYNGAYSGHSIEITLPANHPMITISTGNRGRTNLLYRQRWKYYYFVDGVYSSFLANSRKH